MAQPPATRPSLLVRIRDATDREAWYEFAAIYRPVIVRLARQKGLQEADAEDLAQQVLLAVSGAIQRWESDPQRAKFRTWLNRVTQNAILNALTRGVPDRASGESAVRALVDQKAVCDGPDSECLHQEYRREVFRWAAAQIQEEFHTVTWQAFWRTTVEGQGIPVVAKALGQQRGAVYAARSRIMRRLKEKVRDFERKNGDGENQDGR